MKKLGSKGQVLMEVFATMGLTFAILVSGLSVLYFAWAKLWIRHVLYEAIICEMKEVPRHVCEREARTKIHTGLPIGGIKDFQLNQSFNKSNGRIRFEINKTFWIVEGMTLAQRKPNGFVHIYFLIPFVFCILIACSLLTLILKERSEHLQSCHHQLLLANEEIENGIREVIELNPKILLLQKQREVLEHSRAVAVSPKAQAALQVLILRNEAQQVAITTVQKKLKAQAITKSAGQLSKLLEFARLKNVSQLKITKPQLLLQPQLTKHTAKTQSRPINFSKLHRLTSSWKYSYTKLNIIFPIPKNFAQHFQVSCATNIRREGFQWHAQISL